MSDFAAFMKKVGVPVTRENYIACAYGDPVPEWTAELEGELPEELQNWSLFAAEGENIVYRGNKQTSPAGAS